MKADDFPSLTREIEQYKSTKDHAGLMQRMVQLELETSDPEVRAVVLMAMANSALNLNNLTAANEALSRIDGLSLTKATQNYVNIMRSAAAQTVGHLAEADQLLSTILSTEEIHCAEQHDLFCEALAQKGFVQADMNHFGVALELLDMASTIAAAEGLPKDLHQSVVVYKGYCLQGLGRLDEAEECLVGALRTPGNSGMDIHYRLGAVQLQKGEIAAAKSSFQNALNHTPTGQVQQEHVLSALREAESRLVRPKEPRPCIVPN